LFITEDTPMRTLNFTCWTVTLLLIVLTVQGPRRLCAVESTYAVTKGYDQVLDRINHLERESQRLSPSAAQKLLSEGRSLVEVEEGYRRETTSIQQEIKRSQTTSKTLESARTELERDVQ